MSPIVERSPGEGGRSLEDTGLGKKGGDTEGAQKKRFWRDSNFFFTRKIFCM